MRRFALTLVILGALNWLLVGIFRWNLVEAIFGTPEHVVTRIVYTLIGLAGLYSIGFLFEDHTPERRED